ncbi:MAG: hypothetical protein STSR0008_07340 [Ignavibacterium sp.]
MPDKFLTKDQPIYSISAAAELLGISVHTLRMYEKESLILVSKNNSNQRRYSESDLERIKCLRNAINIDKISIEGIKRILSLIPCWKIINCSKEERKNCKAFKGHLKPCWVYHHINNSCSSKECRECDVYNIYVDCTKIKEMIK